MRESDTTSSALPGTGISNPDLFALGKLLIELLYNMPFQDFRAWFKETEDGDSGDFRVALGMLDDKIYLEGGGAYGDAVRRCIKCDFNQQSYSIDSDDMKKAVHQGVIIELENNFCFMYSKDALSI
ncbi:MAG: hypothetical protein M1814_002938 [Vezdaea aestivalis]|nr:MAG: hypothetical protein M1814_002938 [Vezdaea aestivalis]